jgi:hypothetical protein
MSASASKDSRMRSIGFTGASASRIAIAALGVALWATPAAGQTLFAWPDTAVDIATYTRLEECQAAVLRSREFTQAAELVASGVWSDTIPLDSAESDAARQPLPAPVVGTVQRCGVRFSNADSVSLDDFDAMTRMYLEARWDDKARRLIDRRIAAVDPGKDAELAAVVDTVFEILLRDGMQLGGRRGDMATEIALEHIPRIEDRVKQLRLYSKLTLAASAEEDPDSARARVLRVVGLMTPIVESLTEKELDELLSEYGVLAEGIEDGGDFVQRYYAMLNISLGKQTFLDSLRRSTAAYVRMQKGNWSRATGMRPETYKLGNPLGEKVPPIHADIWLGYDPSNGPRPAPGRISLVVFFDPHECLGTATTPEEVGGACARSLYPLGRLEQRFPELDITVVAQTTGHYAYEKEGMTPEKEARLVKQWLESLGVNAPLAMSSSEYWRLPDPDSRRLGKPSETAVAYTFGRSHRGANSGALLIDGDGTVVHTRQMNRWAEFEDYNELIEILLQRQRDPREIVP